MAGLTAVSTAGECAKLAIANGDSFDGNAGGDMQGCMRYRDGSPAGSWRFSANGVATTRCAGSVSSTGYECLCGGGTPSAGTIAVKLEGANLALASPLQESPSMLKLDVVLFFVSTVSTTVTLTLSSGSADTVTGGCALALTSSGTYMRTVDVTIPAGQLIGHGYMVRRHTLKA
jgi:hypothetical protein